MQHLLICGVVGSAIIGSLLLTAGPAAPTAVWPQATWRAVIWAMAFFLANCLKLVLFDRILALEPLSPLDLAVNLAVTAPVTAAVLAQFLRPRLFRWLPVVYGLQAVYLFVSLAYFTTTGGLLHTPQWWCLAGEGLDAAAHGAVPFDWRLLIVGLDLPVFVGWWLVGRRQGALLSGPLPRRLRLATAVALAVPLLAYAAAVRARLDPLRIYERSFRSDTQIVAHFGLLAVNVVDLVRLPAGADRLQPGPERTIASPSAGARRNVVLIQVEALDANLIEARHKGDWVVPFLHRLSTEAVYFPYALSHRQAGNSSDCTFACLNSIEPLSDYPTIKLRTYDYPNAVVRRLRDAGYRTIAFHGQPGRIFSFNTELPRHGFVEFYDQHALALPTAGFGAADGPLLAAAATRLAAGHGPYFAYLLTNSSHEPFNSVPRFRPDPRFADVSPRLLRDYCVSFAYVDAELSRLVPQLLADGRTTVILVGDHTPFNTRTDVPLVAGPTFRTCALHRDGVRLEFVPLLIVTPDGRRYREPAAAVSFLDVAPTILAAAGGEWRYATDGDNLLSLPFTNPCIRFAGRSYPRTELYQWAAQTTGGAAAESPRSTP